MTWTAVRYVVTEVELDDAPGVTAAAQWSVLATLAYHANEDGEAWPAVATIAKITHLSGRVVQRALRALEDAGHIEGPRNDDRRKGGRNLSTRYQIHRRYEERVTP